MEEDQVADVWMIFKEYIDKKHLNAVAERYIKILLDHSVGDDVLRSVSEVDESLANAIASHLDDWEDED